MAIDAGGVAQQLSSTTNGEAVPPPHTHKFGNSYAALLDKYENHIDTITKKYSSVMQVCFDLRYPDDYFCLPDNKHVHDFNYNFKRNLGREIVSGGHVVGPQIIWVREQMNSSQPHFHYVFLVNCNAKKSYYAIIKTVKIIYNI